MTVSKTGGFPADPSTATPLLVADGLALHFGGVAALAGVSFTVLPHELFAVIGPNGAGKTSILNCISGVHRPQEGAIRLAGTELVGRRPAAVARLGVARTFQNLGLFAGLDVIDNLILGRHTLTRSGLLAGMVWLGRARREDRESRSRVADLVDLLGLGFHAHRPVGSLPYGVQKRVELGRALAMEPRLLLLDEPVAGMNTGETEEMAGVLADVRAATGLAMILVEHDMRLVMDVADRVMVVDFGVPIATGTPAEIQVDPRVLDAYLGRAHR